MEEQDRFLRYQKVDDEFFAKQGSIVFEVPEAEPME